MRTLAVFSALVVVVVIGVLLVWLVQVSATGPVPRHRLLAFAVRQELTITPDNGDLVIRYLATTRRWRTAGLMTGVACAALWALRDGEVRFDALSAFAGWFVGVAALAVPAVVGRHVLERRQPADLAPDVLAADDAVRRRSLHVLAGSALALVAWPSATLVQQVPAPDTAAFVLVATVVVGSVVGGWLIARTPYRLQPHPDRAPVA